MAKKDQSYESRMSLHRRVRHRLTCRHDICPHRLEEIAARAPKQSFYDRPSVRHDCGPVRAVRPLQSKKINKDNVKLLPSITHIDFWAGMIHAACVKYDERYLMDIACHLTSNSAPSEQYAIVAAASRQASDLAILAGLLELENEVPDLLRPEDDDENEFERREDPSSVVKFLLRICLDLAKYPGHVTTLRNTLEDVERKEALEDEGFLEIFGVGGRAWNAE